VSADKNIINQHDPLLRAGQKIYITVEAGTERIDKDINIVYKESGLRAVSRPLEGCGGRDCNPGEIGTTDYKTGSNWYGEYCARVKSYDATKYWESCFKIR